MDFLALETQIVNYSSLSGYAPTPPQLFPWANSHIRNQQFKNFLSKDNFDNFVSIKIQYLVRHVPFGPPGYAYGWEQGFNLNIGYASNCKTKVATKKIRHLKYCDNQERVEVNNLQN